MRSLASGAAAALLAGLLWSALPATAAQPTRRPTDAARGEELYRRHCVGCHGVRNGGDGPATEALVAPVPDLVGQVNTQDASVKTVLRGRGLMPGYEASFDRQDAVRVLAYMARLGPELELAPAPAPAPEAKPRAARPLPGRR